MLCWADLGPEDEGGLGAARDLDEIGRQSTRKAGNERTSLTKLVEPEGCFSSNSKICLVSILGTNILRFLKIIENLS